MANEKEPISLYVHVPFCARKCAYCDFYSVDYLECVHLEYVHNTIFGIGEVPFARRGERASSIFFGGGTPSIIPSKSVVQMLDALRENYDVMPDAEITIEANPGAVTLEKLADYRWAGFNRLSIGLQSADDRMLKKLGRIHTYDQFVETYENAHQMQFWNINVDLIAGLPGQTPEEYEKALKRVISLRPTHLSVYDLIIAENTPFYALYNPLTGLRREEMPDEKTDREITAITNELLGDAGYHHYEISNYALPGYECRHNIGYWTGQQHLGFGPGAASFVYCDEGEDVAWMDSDGEKTDGDRNPAGKDEADRVLAKRFRNACSLDWYDRPFEETESLTKQDLEAEFMMLGLRMTDGISDADFMRRFGESFFDRYGDIIRKYSALHVLENCGDGKIRLTPYGTDVSNVLFREFL